LLRRLEKQQDHLFTFLDVEEVEATNNLAERQLRPAVIALKVSCGNKTPKAAHTWEILTSLAASYAQQAESFALLVSQSALLSIAR
jgi:transposase